MVAKNDLENNRLASSSSLGSTGASSEISMEVFVEKVGGAEVEEDMFRNIWHEYLFIFLVTSAQLITVSYYYITVIRCVELTISDSAASQSGKHNHSYKPYIRRAWVRSGQNCGPELVHRQLLVIDSCPMFSSR